MGPERKKKMEKTMGQHNRHKRRNPPGIAKSKISQLALKAIGSTIFRIKAKDRLIFCDSENIIKNRCHQKHEHQGQEENDEISGLKPLAAASTDDGEGGQCCHHACSQQEEKLIKHGNFSQPQYLNR